MGGSMGGFGPDPEPDPDPDPDPGTLADCPPEPPMTVLPHPATRPPIPNPRPRFRNPRRELAKPLSVGTLLIDGPEPALIRINAV